MNLVLRRRVRQPSSFFNFADPVIKWWVALALKNIPRSSKRYLIPLMFTLCPFANFLIERVGIFLKFFWIFILNLLGLNVWDYCGLPLSFLP